MSTLRLQKTFGPGYPEPLEPQDLQPGHAVKNGLANKGWRASPSCFEDKNSRSTVQDIVRGLCRSYRIICLLLERSLESYVRACMEGFALERRGCVRAVVRKVSQSEGHAPLSNSNVSVEVSIFIL